MTQREAIKLLKEAGFVLRDTTGHIQYKKGDVKIAVPNHKGDLRPHEVAHIRAAIKKAEG